MDDQGHHVDAAGLALQVLTDAQGVDLHQLAEDMVTRIPAGATHLIASLLLVANELADELATATDRSRQAVFSSLSARLR